MAARLASVAMTVSEEDRNAAFVFFRRMPADMAHPAERATIQ